MTSNMFNMSPVMVGDINLDPGICDYKFQNIFLVTAIKGRKLSKPTIGI